MVASRFMRWSRIAVFLGTALAVWACLMAVGRCEPAPKKQPKDLPSFSTVQKIIRDHFADYADFRTSDVISKRDVKPIFHRLAQRGWKVSDEKEILALILDDGHILAQLRNDPAGKRFMRKVASDPTVYDRLDRISQHERGKPLIDSIVRLPDGEKYAKANPGRNPSMADLLLVNERGNAQTRTLKDFHKPTGMLYTVDAFVVRLKKSYKKDAAKRKQSPQPQAPQAPATIGLPMWLGNPAATNTNER